MSGEAKVVKCWVFPWRVCGISPEVEEVPLALCEVCIKAYIELLKHPLVRRVRRE
jgi:hypothetical protein